MRKIKFYILSYEELTLYLSLPQLISTAGHRQHWTPNLTEVQVDHYTA